MNIIRIFAFARMVAFTAEVLMAGLLYCVIVAGRTDSELVHFTSAADAEGAVPGFVNSAMKAR